MTVCHDYQWAQQQRILYYNADKCVGIKQTDVMLYTTAGWLSAVSAWTMWGFSLVWVRVVRVCYVLLVGIGLRGMLCARSSSI